MPEEVNRVVTDHCSSVLFCPTETAVRNLQAEGFRNVVADSDLASGGEPLSNGPVVANVGDVMLDIAQQTDRMLASRSPGKAEVLERFGLRPREYVLATIHRASNTDEERSLRGILAAMQEVARGGLTVLFPIHPRTRRALERFDLSAMLETDGLIAGDPVSYLDMIALESQARLLLTDSGGVQKEAYFFGVPCVVAREETEWTELVEIGWNRIAGAETGRIVEAVRATLAEDFSGKSRIEFYGDGHAAKRIAAVLRSAAPALP
jgi:UDP-N-acetylglucosamine 2-epimerase